MATSLTDHAEELLLNLALGTSAGSTSAGVWLALGLWENGTYGPWDETGTGGTEIGTGLGYARQPIAFDRWRPVVSEVDHIDGLARVWTDNLDPLVFGPATSDWGSGASIFGQLRYGALFDAVTGGNCLAYLDVVGFPIAEGIPAGKILTIAPGSLKIVLETFGNWGEFTREVMEHLLKHLTGQATYLPSTRYFALGTPNAYAPHEGSLTNERWFGAVTPTSGGGYARVSTAGKWGAAVQSGIGAKIQLTEDVPFPVATTAWWETFAPPDPTLCLMDHPTAGHLVCRFGSGVIQINAGDRLVIRPADLIPRLRE